MSAEATPVDDVAAKREPSLLLSLLGCLRRDMEPVAMINSLPDSHENEPTNGSVQTRFSSLAGLLIATLHGDIASKGAELSAVVAERDHYKQNFAILKRELDRLNDLQKTPREHVDLDQVQLLFAEFEKQILDRIQKDKRDAAGASPEGAEPEPPPAPPPDDKKKEKKRTPHGRARLSDVLRTRTLLTAPVDLPEGAEIIGEEVTFRLEYQRAHFEKLKMVRSVIRLPEGLTADLIKLTTTLYDGDVSSLPAHRRPAGTLGPLSQSDDDNAVVAGAPALLSVAWAAEAVDAEQTPSGDLQVVDSALVEAGSFGPTVLVPEVPDEMIPRGLPTPSVLARVFTAKFADKIPFHRQQGIYARSGVHITRGTMCGWASACHDLTKDLVDAMLKDAQQNAHYICTDATGVLVQANEKCKRGHFWVVCSDEDQVVLRYSSRHLKEVPQSLMKDFTGAVVCDASSVYAALFNLPDGPIESGCWSHGRRYFYKALASDRDRALVGIGFCNKLFANERAFKGMSAEKRLALRRELSGPVIEVFETWRDEQLADEDVADQTPFRKALNYVRNHWLALTRFLEDGRIPIHNNRSERELRQLVVGRANWLFVGSDASAEWTCTFVSLVASCQILGIDPEEYLRDLFRVLPMWPKSRLLELAPKRWRATRARLQDDELALPLGPVTIPRRLTEEPTEQLDAGQATAAA